MPFLKKSEKSREFYLSYFRPSLGVIADFSILENEAERRQSGLGAIWQTRQESP